MEKERIEYFGSVIIDSCFTIHKEIGPGLLESAYQNCLAYELNQRGLVFEKEKPLPLVNKGVSLDCAYRMDFVVEGCILLELKAIDQLLPIHKAQVITYLKLANLNLGFLINFNDILLKSGIQRIVLNY
jgi:GxxExxY protein